MFRCLDGGAYGVICPDVQTLESARAFADACKYAPAGRRGFGPVRPVLGAPGAENAAVMAIVQIESPAGLDNVEAIMATPGVDGVLRQHLR